MADDPDFYKNILENLYDGVYFVDPDRRITYWNKGSENITGYSATQVVGKHCRDNVLNHVLANGTLLCSDHCPLSATMRDGRRREAEVFLHHADGHRLPVLVRAAPIYNDKGEITGAVETFSDNTKQILTRRKNEQLEKTAFSDQLTKVGNRRHIEMKLKSELSMFHDSGNQFGLLFIDADHFKNINDTYGHAIGDIALCMIANTLHFSLRDADTLGRWGGEEFIVLLNNVSDKELEVIAKKLLFLISESRYDTDSGSVRLTASIGATMVNKFDDSESIIARGDKLMYQSKENGRNRITLG